MKSNRYHYLVGFRNGIISFEMRPDYHMFKNVGIDKFHYISAMDSDNLFWFFL